MPCLMQYIFMSSLDVDDVVPDVDLVSKFSLLITKLNACVIHLEQFPIKVEVYGLS